MKTSAHFCVEDCGLPLTDANHAAAMAIYEAGAEIRRRAYARYFHSAKTDRDRDQWAARYRRSHAAEARLITRLRKETLA